MTNLVTARPSAIRVLLRNDEGLFLQPSGEWAAERDTARRFKNSSFAYFWAREQQLPRSFVVIAFADPARDMSILVA